MTTIYSNSTAIPHGSGDPNTGIDNSKLSFDIYEAYQRALADEEVSLVPVSRRSEVCSHPSIQISPPLAAILSLTELVTRSDGKVQAPPLRLHETLPSLA